MYSVHLFYKPKHRTERFKFQFLTKVSVLHIKCKKCLACVFFALLYFIAIVEKDALHYNYISHFRTIRNVWGCWECAKYGFYSLSAFVARGLAAGALASGRQVRFALNGISMVYILTVLVRECDGKILEEMNLQLNYFFGWP